MHMHFFKALAIILGIALVGAIVFVATGIYHPAADNPHWPVTYKLMEVTRDRGIAVRATGIVVPPLDDPALIRQGGGNYNAMCSGCHLAPGIQETELHKGLYPAPPNLSALGVKDPARAFWVIKHGMKMSAMPAWGKSMSDPYIWGLVAFLQRLPTLTPEQYKEMSAGGHHHGGGEDHHHDGIGEGEHHHDEVPMNEAEHDHAESESGHHHHDDMPMNEADHDHAGAESDYHHDSMPADTHEHDGMDAPAHILAGAAHEHGGSNNATSTHDHMDMQGIPMGSGESGHSHGKPGAAMAGMQGMDMSGMQGMDHAGMSMPARVIGPAEAAVTAFHDAQQIGNINLAMQWLAPDLVVEEDGHTEHSRAEYAASHLGADIAFLKASRIRLLQSSAQVNGSNATVTSQTRITSLPGHKSVDVVSQEIATLRKTAEGWRIVRLQWSSAPAPGDAHAMHHH